MFTYNFYSSQASPQPTGWCNEKAHFQTERRCRSRLLVLTLNRLFQ